MENKNFDLFLLMMNLSQIKTSEEIKRVYEESINEYFPDIEFKITNDKDPLASTHFQIQKGQKNFGIVSIYSNFEKYDAITQALIRNSIGMLSIILENREYERKLSEKALTLKKSLEENEKMLASLIQMIPDIIYIYNIRTSEHVFSNNSIMGILKFSSEEMKQMGKGFLIELVHPDDMYNVYNHHLKLLQTELGEVKEVEFRIKDKNNNWHWLLSRDLSYTKDERGLTELILGCSTDISNIKNTEENLISTIKEKDVLLKELHHRVKNNLAIISSFLSLQTYSIKDEKIKKPLIESKNRISTMALVHEELYKSGNFSGIDIRKYIYDLVKNLLLSYNIQKKRIKVEYNIENYSIDFNNIIPLALIINELVSNSIKYAFKDKKEGLIKINFIRQKNNFYCLEIIDNGTGLPDNFNPSTSDSLGYKIINALVTQLNGNLEIKNNKGTIIKILLEEI